jgi:hypothetical protein
MSCTKKKCFLDYQYEYFRHINSGLYGSLEVCMKMDLKHACKLCLNVSFRVTKMAMVGSAALRLCYVTGVIYSESLPAHTTVLIINSKFLPTASYRLTYSIGTRRCKFFPELLTPRRLYGCSCSVLGHKEVTFLSSSIAFGSPKLCRGFNFLLC